MIHSKQMCVNASNSLEAHHILDGDSNTIQVSRGGFPPRIISEFEFSKTGLQHHWNWLVTGPEPIAEHCPSGAFVYKDQMLLVHMEGFVTIHEVATGNRVEIEGLGEGLTSLFAIPADGSNETIVLYQSDIVSGINSIVRVDLAARRVVEKTPINDAGQRITKIACRSHIDGMSVVASTNQQQVVCCSFIDRAEGQMVHQIENMIQDGDEVERIALDPSGEDSFVVLTKAGMMYEIDSVTGGYNPCNMLIPRDVMSKSVTDFCIVPEEQELLFLTTKYQCGYAFNFFRDKASVDPIETRLTIGESDSCCLAVDYQGKSAYLSAGFDVEPIDSLCWLVSIVETDEKLSFMSNNPDIGSIVFNLVVLFDNQDQEPDGVNVPKSFMQ